MRCKASVSSPENQSHNMFGNVANLEKTKAGLESG